MRETRTHLDVDARLTRLEAGLQHLGSRFDSFLEEQRHQAKALEDTIGKLRTPFSSLAGWAGVVATLVIAVVAAAYTILNDKVKTVELVAAAQSQSVRGVVDLNVDRIAQLRSELTVIRGDVSAKDATVAEKLREVETQFRAGGQLYNAVDHRHDILIDQLWRRVFGASLRDDTPWPILGKD